MVAQLLFLYAILCYDILMMQFLKNLDWAQQQRLRYTGMALGLILLILVYPIYQVVSKAPTCFDKKQNGNEVGVDCGGSCALFCPSQIITPQVSWAKAFQVSPGVYDLGAYVKNLNPNAGIKAMKYTFFMYDDSGNLIQSKEGKKDFDPGSSTLVFESGLTLSTPPARTEIQFSVDDFARWIKTEKIISTISIKNQGLTNADVKPRFSATVVNTDPVNDIGKIEFGAVIYDSKRNPVAVSQTYIDSLANTSEQNIFFTWPNRISRNPRGGMCMTPVDTMLVFDRSGSMDIGKKNPPEPLTTAKNAASAYVESADTADKVGLVSFATTASSPIDQELSSDHASVQSVVGNITIDKGSLQETNLGDALKAAVEELLSDRYTKNAKRVIVALTDGVANKPVDPTNKKNKLYPEQYAITQAGIARMGGIELYTIGLGKDINTSFLKDHIATDASHYFSALTAQDLQGIYKNISESVCVPEDFITEIIASPGSVFTQ